MPVKKCTKCGAVKALTEFYKHKRMAGGHTADCKDCNKASSAKYNRNNKDKISSAKSQYYAENTDQLLKRGSEWRANNRGAVNALSAKHRAQKLQATPAWADKDAIKALYEEAQRLQEILGIQFHIDHVLPLQGELVCGLHVETNLAIIPATLNLKKSNKFKVQ